ncbi:Histidine kinase-like ATPase, ATP-binding domain-containing protein, partial [Cynara cardunculus var. scolymus]
MENDNGKDIEVKVLSSLWPEDIDATGKELSVGTPGVDQDFLKDVTFIKEPTVVDVQRLIELTNYSEKGSSQLSHLVKSWEKKQEKTVRLLREELENLSKQQEVELKKLKILEEHPDEDIIGKTDLEIFKGGGVKESRDFKKEVLERGLPGKKEITFETELFGAKTILIYVEPVFSKAGETIGVNYMGMDITDQVRKREKMAKLREEIAVQKTTETELDKTIHITGLATFFTCTVAPIDHILGEETERAEKLLATMSQEIRSPLSEIVSMAEILSTTKLDSDQKQLLSVVLSSGDLVLQHINDILDLLNVESGVMKLEATKFRPREMITHVLQTAAASLRKMLILEGNVADDVPIEVIGDVHRIQQVLTNLIRDHQEPKIDTEDLHDHEENESQSHETALWICCDVQDTGIGIPETALPLIFKKNTKDSGTALSLAICKQVVELMGGSVTVSSKEHCGSTFTFVLPLKVPLACESLDEADEFRDTNGNASTEDDETKRVLRSWKDPVFELE